MLSEGGGEYVVELFHRDLVVVVRVKASEKSVLLVVGDVDVHGSETSGELVKIDVLITVFVKLLEQVNGVALQVRVVAGWSLDLVDDGRQGGFWEDVRVVFHVLFGVLVHAHQHKLKAAKKDGAAEEEVLFSVVVVVDCVPLLLALHETATNAPAVFVTDLVDLDRVITTVETDDEGAGLIVGVGGDKFGVEPKNVHVLFKHLLHVELRRLGLQSNNAAHGVFLSTVASVRGNSLVEYIGGGLLEWNGDLIVVGVTSVPVSSEVVDVVD